MSVLETGSAWPERPTCHGDEPRQRPVWQSRDGQRHCSYCGSLHPADLRALLDAGARLGGSDWKYGWPHKFYVEGPGGPAKWYNRHLLDEGYRADALAALLADLTLHSGITFRLEDDGRIAYSAPYHGYQRVNRDLGGWPV